MLYIWETWWYQCSSEVADVVVVGPLVLNVSGDSCRRLEDIHDQSLHQGKTSPANVGIVNMRVVFHRTGTYVRIQPLIAINSRLYLELILTFRLRHSAQPLLLPIPEHRTISHSNY